MNLTYSSAVSIPVALLEDSFSAEGLDCAACTSSVALAKEEQTNCLTEARALF